MTAPEPLRGTCPCGEILDDFGCCWRCDDERDDIGSPFPCPLELMEG